MTKREIYGWRPAERGYVPDAANDLARRRTEGLRHFVMRSPIENLLMSAYIQGMADAADAMSGREEKPKGPTFVVVR